jgi:hypothetical protein
MAPAEAAEVSSKTTGVQVRPDEYSVQGIPGNAPDGVPNTAM